MQETGIVFSVLHEHIHGHFHGWYWKYCILTSVLGPTPPPLLRPPPHAHTRKKLWSNIPWIFYFTPCQWNYSSIMIVNKYINIYIYICIYIYTNILLYCEFTGVFIKNHVMLIFWEYIFLSYLQYLPLGSTRAGSHSDTHTELPSMILRVVFSSRQE